MPVLSIAIAVAVGIILMLRKARFHYERLPKIPYVAGAQIGDVTVIVRARYETGEAPAAEGEWLLFVDADTRYTRVFVPSLLAYAHSEDLEAVSVILKPEALTLPEKLLLPYAFALYFTGVNSSRLIANPPREWLASSQCLLVKREAYPALAAAKGIRARVARAEHFGSARICYSEDIPGTMRENPFALLQVLLAYLLMLSWLPILIMLILDGYNRQAVLFAVLPAVILFPWYRSGYALLAPVAIYLFPFLALNTLRGRKGREA